MKSITLIGSSHYEPTIILSSPLHQGRRNNAEVLFNYGGTIYNVTENLAIMGLQPTILTKLGNDYHAVEMWNRLNDLGATITGPTIDLPTPKRVVMIDQDLKTTNIFDKPNDFYFNPGDFLPHNFFSKSDYSVCDIKDDVILADLFQKTINTKWIVCNYVPSRELLKDVYGIIIDYSQALSLGTPSEFERICYRLTRLGPKFILINQGLQGVYYYSDKLGLNYPSKCNGKGYNNGCFAAFIAGVLAGLAINSSLEIAINIGLNAEAITYKTKYLVDKEIANVIQK